MVDFKRSARSSKVPFKGAEYSLLTMHSQSMSSIQIFWLFSIILDCCHDQFTTPEQSFFQGVESRSPKPSQADPGSLKNNDIKKFQDQLLKIKIKNVQRHVGI
jgi:hypothetical protein